MSTVENGKVVGIRYTLEDENGKELEATGDETEIYLHGGGSVLPGLERALTGKKVGDKLEVVLPPEDAYGNRRRGPGAQAVPRASFPDDVELLPGMAFDAESPGGAAVTLYITRLERDKVFVDTQHPLAGHTLRYHVEVVEVRDPTPEELAHGHVHSGCDHEH
jgi:FKBP-type peptidyl-prolyl cis-trans isomerase SlyD